MRTLKQKTNFWRSSIMLFNEMLQIAKSDYITFLFILILFDFITGFLKSWKWKVTDSWVGLKGIIKHTCTFLFYFMVNVFLLHVNAMALGQILLIIINLYYVLSIMENLAVMGVYIPNFMQARVQEEMKRYVEKLEHGKEEYELLKGKDKNV